MVLPAGNRPSPQANFGSSFYRRPDNPNRGKARDAKRRDWSESWDLWAATWSVHVEKRRCDKRDHLFFIGLTVCNVIGRQLGNFRPDSGGQGHDRQTSAAFPVLMWRVGTLGGDLQLHLGQHDKRGMRFWHFPPFLHVTGRGRRSLTRSRPRRNTMRSTPPTKLGQTREQRGQGE